MIGYPQSQEHVQNLTSALITSHYLSTAGKAKALKSFCTTLMVYQRDKRFPMANVETALRSYTAVVVRFSEDELKLSSINAIKAFILGQTVENMEYSVTIDNYAVEVQELCSFIVENWASNSLINITIAESCLIHGFHVGVDVFPLLEKILQVLVWKDDKAGILDLGRLVKIHCTKTKIKHNEEVTMVMTKFRKILENCRMLRPDYLPSFYLDSAQDNHSRRVATFFHPDIQSLDDQ